MRNVFVFVIGTHDERAQRNLATSIEDTLDVMLVLDRFDEVHQRELVALREEASGSRSGGQAKVRGLQLCNSRRRRS